MMIINIIMNFRRPNGEALENFPPAEGRPVGGVRGGGSPPATIIHYYNWKGEALEQRTKHSSLSTGQRPASRGGAGGQHAPPNDEMMKAPERRSARASTPANGRPVGVVQGRQRPPAQHYYHY